MSTAVTRHFRNGLSCSLHSTGSGSIKIMKSMMTLEIALPSHQSERLIQWPGIFTDQALETGVHWNTEEGRAKINQAITNVPVAHRDRVNQLLPCVVKTRA